MQFRPHGKERLKDAHEADIHADVNGGADRQRGQRLIGIARGHHRIGHAKRHDGQLAHQDHARVAPDVFQFGNAAMGR